MTVWGYRQKQSRILDMRHVVVDGEGVMIPSARPSALVLASWMDVARSADCPRLGGRAEERSACLRCKKAEVIAIWSARSI